MKLLLASEAAFVPVAGPILAHAFAGNHIAAQTRAQVYAQPDSRAAPIHVRVARCMRECSVTLQLAAAPRDLTSWAV
jgi:hypothetical protein